MWENPHRFLLYEYYTLCRAAERGLSGQQTRLSPASVHARRQPAFMHSVRVVDPVGDGHDSDPTLEKIRNRPLQRKKIDLTELQPPNIEINQTI